MAATKNKHTVIEEGSPEALSDREASAAQPSPSAVSSEPKSGQVPEELSEHELFAGDQDFYKLLADSAEAAATQQDPGASWHRPVFMWGKRFSTIQKVIAAGIITLVVMLLYTLVKTPSRPNANTTPPAFLQKQEGGAMQQPPLTKPSTDDSTQVTQKTVEKPESTAQSRQPTSLKVAETFYLKKDYNKAYNTYNQLYQNLPAKGDEELISDFLQLKMALCIKETADSDQTSRLFRTLSQSRSPIVRLMTNYHLALLEMQNRQYLKARTRAYQTIALIGTADFDKDWAVTIQRDCHFMVAESITRNILSLCDAEKDIPRDLWEHPAEPDPFTNLDELQLRSILSRGSDQLSKGLLGPQIQKLERPEKPLRWSVVCHGAPIDELLARFAANADIDVYWTQSVSAAGEETKNAARQDEGPAVVPIRKRPVSLCLPAATMQEFVSVAAGHIGLLARLDEKGVVNIFDPAEYSSLSEHLSILIPEAISLWQGFLLTFHDDQRVPNGHFALGLLHSQNGQVAEAIAEYKLVANRFSQTSLAPSALLNSSKLKSGLRDYAGAREDLRQLVEQYPDNEFYGQACLHFADATMKAGLWEEAIRLYRKVYNLGLSLESRTASALGAGRCSYEKQDYAGAAEWLTRYIELAGTRENNDLCRVYYLLGKTNLALGKPQQACDAFQYALTGQLPKEEYIETALALVEAKTQTQNFVEALALLENMQPWQFSQKEYIEILLAKSKVLRSMGLTDKAITTLGDKAEYLDDPKLKARVSFELAECLAAGGDLELARSKLAEILTFVEPGFFAHEVALKLAEVCLKLGQNAQTISICSQLLNSRPSAQIRQKALNTLATAYQQQKNYDRAAMALADKWDANEH
jgi:tetratricopeptide (TPR) repeat protein